MMPWQNEASRERGLLQRLADTTLMIGCYQSIVSSRSERNALSVTIT